MNFTELFSTIKKAEGTLKNRAGLHCHPPHQTLLQHGLIIHPPMDLGQTKKSAILSMQT